MIFHPQSSSHPNSFQRGKPLPKATIQAMMYNDSLPVPAYFGDRQGLDQVLTEPTIRVGFALKHGDVLVPYLECFHLYDSSEHPDGMWEAVVPFIHNIKALRDRAKASHNKGTPLTASEKAYRKRVQEATKRWKKEYRSEHGGGLFCC